MNKHNTARYLVGMAESTNWANRHIHALLVRIWDTYYDRPTDIIDKNMSQWKPPSSDRALPLSHRIVSMNTADVTVASSNADIASNSDIDSQFY